ncbi:organic anion transporter 3-like [Macrobrachium rosenbergii]|uniref:organic anion transporter 3-like n=1 Tax=Macrobrachium rosenbergii TaxID=79674 RepID=UPI0034D7B232
MGKKCDHRYGRRPVILVCSALSFVCALGAAFSPLYSLYVFLRVAVAFFSIGYYTGCFVYSKFRVTTMEICSHRQRSVVGSIGGVPWSLGFLVVPGIAYLVRPWRWMQVAYSAPMLLLVSFYCTDPYLYVAFGSLVEVPGYLISWVLIVYTGRRISLAICFWASGVAICILAILVASMDEGIWAICILAILVASMDEGIWAICILAILVASMDEGIWAICILAILVASMDEVPFGLLMTFAMTGKITISTAFVICYLYTAELFPTRYRSLAVGQSSTIGCIGSMMSPYINDILGMVITWAPSALFAMTLALSAILCLLLPETRESITEEQHCPQGRKKNNKKKKKEEEEEEAIQRM